MTAKLIISIIILLIILYITLIISIIKAFFDIRNNTNTIIEILTQVQNTNANIGVQIKEEIRKNRIN